MLTIITGDAREKLKTLPDKSVHCLITSPPYFGLRDYLTATWEAGDPNCQHSCGGQVQDNKNKGAITTGIRPGCDASFCKKCGAIRIDKQVGLEATPQAYVKELVAIFREVKRVLRDDGTFFLNLGDSYVSKVTGSLGNFTGKEHGFTGGHAHMQAALDRPDKTGFGLPEKNLIGIPWRVAFALQEDGWILRQDIIWGKKNPLPESVQDRFCKSHEYVFLFTKCPKYYFDNFAVREPATYAGDERGKRKDNRRGNKMNSMSGTTGETRLKRDVWMISSKPYKGAHFAVFPPDLIRPMILAGCPERVCSKCLTPLTRIVEKERYETRTGSNTKVTGDPMTDGNRDPKRHCTASEHVGWQKHCSCDAEAIGGTVLDCFGGSGTTGEVAEELGRNSILIELNPKYVELEKERTKNRNMFASTSH